MLISNPHISTLWLDYRVGGGDQLITYFLQCHQIQVKLRYFKLALLVIMQNGCRGKRVKTRLVLFTLTISSYN